jgi:phage gpG-like protein
MDSMASMEFTPASKRIINEWGNKKAEAADSTINHFLDGIAAWIGREEAKAFVDSRQQGGKMWAPNSPEYAMRKSMFGQNKPGIVTGHLMDSMEHGVSRTIGEAFAGTKVSYAPFFEFGTSRGIPGRPFTPEEDYTTRHAVELLNQLLKANFK